MESVLTIKNIIIYLVVINLLALLAMYIDKRKAQKNKRRISEKTLFELVFLGGRNWWNSWNVCI